MSRSGGVDGQERMAIGGQPLTLGDGTGTLIILAALLYVLGIFCNERSAPQRQD